jgi:hypothetical protein
MKSKGGSGHHSKFKGRKAGNLGHVGMAGKSKHAAGPLASSSKKRRSRKAEFG